MCAWCHLLVFNKKRGTWSFPNSPDLVRNRASHVCDSKYIPSLLLLLMWKLRTVPYSSARALMSTPGSPARGGDEDCNSIIISSPQPSPPSSRHTYPTMPYFRSLVPSHVAALQSMVPSLSFSYCSSTDRILRAPSGVLRWSQKNIRSQGTKYLEVP